MNDYKDFTPTTIKLSPEVVAARKANREKRLSRTSEEIQEEMQNRRKESLHKAIKENKKEIILTYAFIFSIIIIPIFVYEIWL